MLVVLFVVRLKRSSNSKANADLKCTELIKAADAVVLELQLPVSNCKVWESSEGS